MTVLRLNSHPIRRGEGFGAVRVNGPGAAMDPFLLVDHFRMSQTTFPAHPHAGFAAITYLFDDAQTGFLNRDSTGARVVIRPGDLHCTVSGRGMIHEETPIEQGRVVHGLQIFLNLPVDAQSEPGYALHADGADMPQRQDGSVRTVLAFGDAMGLKSPLRLPTRAGLAIVHFDGPATASLRPEDGGLFALVIDGEVCIGGVAASAGEALTVDASQSIAIEARGASRLAVFSGAPLRQPVFMRGPFALASEAALADSEHRYRTGQFGSV